MEKFISNKQKDISERTGISQPMISQILNGRRRAGWKTAKRLASVITNSTQEQWLEAPPETLRQIVMEYAQQERSPLG